MCRGKEAHTQHDNTHRREKETVGNKKAIV